MTRNENAVCYKGKSTLEQYQGIIDSQEGGGLVLEKGLVKAIWKAKSKHSNHSDVSGP